MASVNKVILIGNLGRDPEVRYSANGGAIVNLGLATSRQWKDKTTGDRVEETEWHRVVLYDRMAEVAGEYLKKGRSVYIEGRLKTRKWQDKDGKDMYTTEVVADKMELLGSREGGGAEEGGGGGGGGGSGYARRGASGSSGGAAEGGAEREAPQRSAPAARPAAAKPAPKSATGFDDMDDDIPF